MKFKLFISVFVVSLIITNIAYSQQIQKSNMFGVLLDGVSSGPGIGVRCWVSNFGYSASVGADWGFKDLNASGRIMYAFNADKNKFFVVGRVGYYEFSDDRSFLGYSMSYKGSLLGVGLGLGYEWFINSNQAISIDGGYNFVGTTDYEMNFMGTKMKYKYEIPYWVGGSYTFYF